MTSWFRRAMQERAETLKELTAMSASQRNETTSRDANNVQRFWRRSKGYWLITHGHGKLERLLGRKVRP